MRAAITTHFHGPTNSRGSRVKAIGKKRESYSDGTSFPELGITDSWDHSHGIEENHCRVAQLCAAKLKWVGVWVGGGTGDGFAFVNIADGDLATIARAVHALDSAHMRQGTDYFVIDRKEGSDNA